ncbi:MAG: hypothetical protein R2745_20525 [Vicinamibacterales bacterium]
MPAPPPVRSPSSVLLPRLHPLVERVFLVFCAVAIALPGLATVAGVDRAPQAAEREDAAPPADAGALPWATLDGWTHALTRAFEGHFAFRDALVRWQAAVRFVVLRVSPQPEVIRGKDGWLFYADDGGLEDYLTPSLLSDEDLATWAATLQHTQDWLAARGIAYLFVIAPGKSRVYPEFMPTSLHPVLATSRARQLLDYLAAHTTVHTLALDRALADEKTRDRIYHRTDSHWNAAGALVASREIVAALGRQVPEAEWDPQALAPDAFERRETVSPGLDLARMLRLDHWLTETTIGRVPRVPFEARVVEPAVPDPEFAEGRVVTVRDGSSLPRALVYRDSFGSALIPFLGEQFSRGVFLWEYDVDPAAVAAERPRVVIQEWASRRLHNRLPYDPFADQQ